MGLLCLRLGNATCRNRLTRSDARLPLGANVNSRASFRFELEVVAVAQLPFFLEIPGNPRAIARQPVRQGRMLLGPAPFDARPGWARSRGRRGRSAA